VLRFASTLTVNVLEVVEVVCCSMTQAPVFLPVLLAVMSLCDEVAVFKDFSYGHSLCHTGVTDY